MIFITKTAPAVPTTKEEAPWVKKFAFLPKCVDTDKLNNTKEYVWLGFYEVRRYFDHQRGWRREYRNPGELRCHEEDANPISHDL